MKKDTQVILDEVQRLSDSIDKLSAQVAELLKKSGIADEKISAIARNQADLAQSKENFMLSMQFFKEELNGVKDSLNKLNDKLLNLPAAPAGALPPGGAGEPAPQGEATLAQDPSSVYYAAYSDYIKENFDLAIEGFRQFIRSFPDSGLADNSLYWIGECHYAKKKYQDAINTFNELLAKYKDGDKVAGRHSQERLRPDRDGPAERGHRHPQGIDLPLSPVRGGLAGRAEDQGVQRIT